MNLRSICRGEICLLARVFWLQSSSSEPRNDSLALVFQKGNFINCPKLENNIIPKITTKRDIPRKPGSVHYIKTTLCPKASLREKTLEGHGAGGHAVPQRPACLPRASEPQAVAVAAEAGVAAKPALYHTQSLAAKPPLERHSTIRPKKTCFHFICRFPKTCFHLFPPVTCPRIALQLTDR